MAWMVTGGAGYIGAHVVRAMLAGGQSVVVYDDLSTGSAEKVPAGVSLVIGSVLDRQRLDAAYFFASGCLVSTTSRSRSPATWV